MLIILSAMLALDYCSNYYLFNYYYLLVINCVRTSPACPPGFGVLNNDLSLSSNEIVPLLRIYNEEG